MLGVRKEIILKVLGVVVCVVIWLSYSISFFLPKRNTTNANEIIISEGLGNGKWEVVSGGLLRDIRRIAFDSSGKRGIAISLEGDLIASKDGGLSWDSLGKMSFSDDGGETWTNEPNMEIINALAITDKGLFIGTAVDQSKYGAIYQLDSTGKWRVQAGNYGGLLAASNNSVMIGSNGLMVKLLPTTPNSSVLVSATTSSQNTTNSQKQKTNQLKATTNTIDSQDLAFQQLPIWAQINLYSIDQKGMNLVVAGDYGFVCKSMDEGKTWKSISPDKTNKLPFYGTAMGKDMFLVGGSGGNFWRFNEKLETWQQIVGLKKNLTIFAVYADKESKQGICVAGGGKEIGESPFILYSSDNGLSWQYELIPQNYGRVTSIASNFNGVFLTTLDGHILLRK